MPRNVDKNQYDQILHAAIVKLRHENAPASTTSASRHVYNSLIPFENNGCDMSVVNELSALTSLYNALCRDDIRSLSRKKFVH